MTEKRTAAEKIEIVNRIRAMQAEGWKEIGGMTDEELDEFESEVSSACIKGMSSDHAHNRARSAAYDAVRHERKSRELAASRLRDEQHRRMRDINLAANTVRKARQLVEYAAAIPYDPDPIPAPVGIPPVGDMGDAELDELLASYSAEAAEAGDYPQRLKENAEAIRLLKTKDARAIAKQVEGQAEARIRRVESLRAATSAITAELGKRAEERAAQEAEREEITANLPMIVKELQGRIAELEGEE